MSKPTHAREHAGARRGQRLLFSIVAVAALIAIFTIPYLKTLSKIARYAPTAARGVLPDGIKRVAVRNKTAAKIVNAARAQIGTHYQAGYQVISYPGGDVAPDKGACTDVVIRALRTTGYDLQKLIHEDMARHFELYPHKWGLAKPDENIDHRRVPNQITFFSRYGQKLSTRVDGSTLFSWQPGDIVFWDMQNGQLHTGVVSDGVSTRDVPLVVHNGWICVEDDSLTRWEIIGHYRYPKRKTH